MRGSGSAGSAQLSFPPSSERAGRSDLESLRVSETPAMTAVSSRSAQQRSSKFINPGAPSDESPCSLGF